MSSNLKPIFVSIYLIFSFLAFNSKAQSDSNHDKTIQNIKELRETKKFKEAEQKCKESFQEVTKNSITKAKILFEFGNLYLDQNKLNTADSLFQLSSSIYFQNKDHVSWASAQLKHAYILQLYNTEDDNILFTLNNILNYENKIEKQDPNLLMDLYNNLAVAYYYKNKMDSLNHYYDKIYELSLKHSLNNITVLINLADYFATNHQIPKALELITQCEDLLKNQKKSNETIFKYTISMSYIYLLANKYDEGINFMSSYIKRISDDNVSSNTKGEFFSQLADLYFAQEKYNRAQEYYTKAVNQISQTNKILSIQTTAKLLITKAKISPKKSNIDNLTSFFKLNLQRIDSYHKAFVQFELSKLNFEINNFTEASSFLEDAKIFYKNDGDEIRLQLVYVLENKIIEVLKTIDSKKKLILSTIKSTDSLVTLERDAIEALTLKNANDQKALEIQAKELELSTEREKSLNSRIQLQNVMIISLLGAILLFVALYQYKKRLQKQKEMAKVREEELQSYNYFVSHDLLQPINNVKNLVHQLGSIPINQKDKINTQLLSAQNIVERLLHLFQIEKTDLYLTPFNVNEWINKIISEYQLTYLEVCWQCFIDQTSNYKLRADVFLLTQCLKNILDNAIKYGSSNENPTITIITALSKNHFILKIADNGSGITDGNEATLFEPFKQLNKNNKSGGGFGVGLSIVKKIIEKHDGHISAQNLPTGGLQMKIELPIN